MDPEKKKTILPEPPKSAEPEEPEEGFVPYCGSDEQKAEQKASRKSKIKMWIFVILLILVIAGFILIFIGRRYNLYSETINSLKFDYRTGEADVPDESLTKGSCAKVLRDQIGDKSVSVDAAMYLFDDQTQLSDTVSVYSYVHTKNSNSAVVKTGSLNWFMTKKQSLESPLLFELLFDTVNYDMLKASCYDTYRAEVSGRQYICEVWLICDLTGDEPVYYTVYRYYDEGRLAGVRVLSDQDEMMQVFDIRSYTIK